MNSDYLEYIYRMMFHVKHFGNIAASITGRMQEPGQISLRALAAVTERSV